MSISYDYDLSKESQLQFEYHLNDIQQLYDGYQQLNQQVTKINQIITLFNEKDNQELIQKKPWYDGNSLVLWISAWA